MNKNKKIILLVLILGLFILSMIGSYAYFSARIFGSESTSTIVGTAAYLELTYTDGNKQINANNIFPGWTESKTFTVENTGEGMAYYVLKLSDVVNNFKIPGSISIEVSSNDGGVNVANVDLPNFNMIISAPVSIESGVTHTYTITTYYNNLDVNQEKDLGSDFTYTIGIEATYYKEINNIEDLVTLSNEVNRGINYAGTTFVLTKDLDFNNNSSYEDATRTDFGDLNEDGTIENIKTELTKETGKGFTPIGNTTNRFKGNFDGNNYIIGSIYINNSRGNVNGLFGSTQNSTISNLTLTGNIKTTFAAQSGGFIGRSYENCTLNNLINNAAVSSNQASSSTAGIVGMNSTGGNIIINNCINTGNINNGNNTGGIIGSNYGKIIIENSHNDGNVTNSKSNNVGGLLGRDVDSAATTTTIINSYNSGDVISSTENEHGIDAGG